MPEFAVAMSGTPRASLLLAVGLALLLTALVVGCGNGTDDNGAPGDNVNGGGNGATGADNTSDGSNGSGATGHVPLWRIRSGDGAESYLLGYLPGGPSGSGALPESVLKRLDQAGTIVLETAYPADGNVTMSRFSALPERETLEGMLPLPTWKAMVGRLPDVDDQQLASLKPWAAARVLRFTLQQSREPTQRWLQQRASQTVRAGGGDGPDLVALEDFLRMYAALDEVPLPEWIREIDFLADAGRGITRQHQQLVEAWRTGDLTALAEERKQRAARMPTWEERVIVARTQAWLGQLPKYLDSGDAFVAVNVFHLVGPDNLVDGLRRQDYTVEQVRD